jgi:hypothetical protein
LEQADWYIKVIEDRKQPITPHFYVDWPGMIQKMNPIFNKVISKAQNLGIYDLLGMWQNWNSELVAQFCSTAWIRGSGYDNTINFSIEGHHYALCVKEILTVFGLANNDFHRADIANERTVADNVLVPPYFSGNESNYDTIHGLLPEFIIFNKIFRGTLRPKRGDRSHISGSTRVLLLAILDNRPPLCISVFFWIEMLYMLKHGPSYVIYAPYVQKIINYKTHVEFEYDGDHSVYLPQLVRTPHNSPSAAPSPATAVATTSAPAHDPPIIGMYPSLLPSPPEMLLVRAKTKIFLSKASRILFPCVAPKTLSFMSFISR